MSIDYAIWKWKTEPPGITAGLCYLLLAEGMECDQVARLNEDRIAEEFETTFPGIWGDEGYPHFSCEIFPTVLFMTTHGTTPQSTLEWFLSWAERGGAVFFDPQDTASITDADKKEFRRRKRASHTKEEAFRLEQDLPDLEMRADTGDAKALFELGNRYSFGEGVRRNPQKAFACYKQSAEAGNADGMFNLAACYRFGEGVERNIEQALYWYERASETDPIFGPFALGEIHAKGEIGEVDRNKAIHYLRTAWENGNQDAVKLLKSLNAFPP